MLELVRIPEAQAILSRYPHQLSGGMRQRVMIAMALSCRPAVLIADEPTTALDVTIQAQILQLIKVLQQEMEMGVIFITHDMGVVADIADRVLVMHKGSAVETGPVEQIFHAPAHPYTKALLAAVPRLGAMNGSDLPRRFPLISLEASEPQEEEREQDTVVPGKPILEVRNLVTRFPLRSGVLNRVKREVHVVENVSFDLWPGETLALVGESGCGKSTTGRALLRLVDAQEGSITFNGERIDTLPDSRLQAVRRDIQFIFQDPYASLDPRHTVGYSIMEPLRVHNLLDGEAAQRRVAWLLERVGLKPEHAWRYPHEFSGGQRQRICIARALALNPKVVIADESVSALDVSIRAQIINLLLDLQRDMGSPSCLSRTTWRWLSASAIAWRCCLWGKLWKSVREERYSRTRSTRTPASSSRRSRSPIRRIVTASACCCRMKCRAIFVNAERPWSAWRCVRSVRVISWLPRVRTMPFRGYNFQQAGEHNGYICSA